MNLSMALTGGEYSLTTGANGSSANALTGVDSFPFSGHFHLRFKYSSTHRRNSDYRNTEGSSAGFAAKTINAEMSKLGISAEATTAISLEISPQLNCEF